ncbi:MAG: oligosaccharide flippase family protein, partial [Minisyncoccia bacterium]
MYTLVLIVTQFLNFIGMVLISRFLGPVSFGIYSFIQIYTTTISTIFIATDLKFHADLARENSDERLRTIAIYFYNKLFLTLIVYILGIIVSFIVLPYDLFILTTI